MALDPEPFDGRPASRPRVVRGQPVPAQDPVAAHGGWPATDLVAAMPTPVRRL